MAPKVLITESFIREFDFREARRHVQTGGEDGRQGTGDRDSGRTHWVH
jgi:hypothetical protein